MTSADGNIIKTYFNGVNKICVTACCLVSLEIGWEKHAHHIAHNRKILSAMIKQISKPNPLERIKLLNFKKAFFII